MLTIKTFYCNPYRECTYVIHYEGTGDNGTKDCIVIDPGMYGVKEVRRVIDYIQERNLTPIAILVTHKHPDHVCGIEDLLNVYPDLPVYGEAYHPTPLVSPQKTDTGERQCMHIGPFDIIEIKTPGHKEDAVCYYFESENIIFTGDTLFEGSIGRTDLPGGDMEQLVESLSILKQLPDDTQVYAGHGSTTTIGHEKKYNIYMNHL